MPENGHKQFAEALSAFAQLRAQSRSLVLATTAADGVPGVSYAPYVYDDDGNFLVYVSGLSAHTRDLLSSSKVAVMLIEDESTAKQIFARKRIFYLCGTTLINRDDSYFETMLDRMAARFGGVVGVLRGLPDFRLFRLTPISGRFVTGFGQAYELGGRDLRELVHIGVEQIKKA